VRFKRVFHVFQNTPLGREMLLGAVHLCRSTGAQLYLFRPVEPRFTIQLADELIEVPLDSTYLESPETAKQHADDLVSGAGLRPHWVEPSHRLASTMPVLLAEFEILACSRSFSDPPSRLAPGQLGSHIRRLIKTGRFPVLILSSPTLEWDRLTVFFGGSQHALKALAWARTVATAAGLDYTVFTEQENGTVDRAEAVLADAGWLEEVRPRWQIIPAGSFPSSLWQVPRTSLVVAGAFGQGALKARLFGSRVELLQSQLPNPLLLVGPSSDPPEG
jgi:nucleotide-binding universal stress UspA family protein